MKQTTAHYDRVKEFMQLAGQETPEGVTIPGPDIRRLRANLIFEKALETINALGFSIYVPAKAGYLAPDSFTIEELHKPNLEELIDGCADISVVTIGTLIAFGLFDIPFLEETDMANLREFGVKSPY